MAYRIGFELEYAGIRPVNITSGMEEFIQRSYCDGTYRIYNNTHSKRLADCYEVCSQPKDDIISLLTSYGVCVHEALKQQCVYDIAVPTIYSTGLHVSVNNTENMYAVTPTAKTKQQCLKLQECVFYDLFTQGSQHQISTLYKKRRVFQRRPYTWYPQYKPFRIEFKHGASSFNPNSLIVYALHGVLFYQLLSESEKIMKDLLRLPEQDNAYSTSLVSDRWDTLRRDLKDSFINDVRAKYMEILDFLSVLCDEPDLCLEMLMEITNDSSDLQQAIELRNLIARYTIPENLRKSRSRYACNMGEWELNGRKLGLKPLFEVGRVAATASV